MSQTPRPQAPGMMPRVSVGPSQPPPQQQGTGNDNTMRFVFAVQPA